MKTKPTMTETHIYRKKNGKIQFLVLKRSESEIYPLLWQMVTGSLKKNEKAFITALREVKEETGLTIKKMWVVPNINSYYEPASDEIMMIPVFLVFTDSESKVRLSDEHIKYKWLSYKQARSLFSWPGQKKSLDIIYEFLSGKSPKLKFVEIKI